MGFIVPAVLEPPFGNHNFQTLKTFFEELRVKEHLQTKRIFGTEKKTLTARDVTGFYTFFSARKSGNFLHIFGRFPC